MEKLMESYGILKSQRVRTLNGLNDMMKYCITPVCRRQQIASYFHDDECTVICDMSCDICSRRALEHLADHGDDAIEVLNCLDSMQQIQPKVTMKLLTIIFGKLWLKVKY